MKKLYFLIALLISFSTISAQEKLSPEEQARREKNIEAGNPFAKYGSKAPVATLSKGKYLEVHDLDSIVTIGTTLWHVDKKQIVGNIVEDLLNPDAQPVGDRAGRWMSIDPLSEEFPSTSPYVSFNNNPIRFIDPDGRAPLDWFKNQQGRVVWFDNTSKGFTDTNGGKWTNVGSNLNEVKQNLNVPTGVQTSNWTTLSLPTSRGKDGNGKQFSAINPVVFNNSAQVDYNLNVNNKGESGQLVSGVTEISGVNISARVSSETSAPGMQITGVGGNFGVKEWTPSGLSLISKSSPFQNFKGPMLSNFAFHATSDATMNVSLFSYKNLTNTSSGQTTGLNLSFNTFVSTTNLSNESKKIFNTNN
ncbi:hypothetical protein [Flavobacterium sp.]|uniref:hypothetical protein n=1 Tax=Flavobacterium sp. TaxID=239 RepID=UPI003753C96C